MRAVRLFEIMTRRLITIAFLVAVAGNALAAVSPHLDGEGDCSARCCELARKRSSNAGPTLSCAINCGQPAGVPAQSSTSSFISSRNERLTLLPAFRSELITIRSIWSAREGSARHIYTSVPIYLETGTLLI
jgi:hypothetical protein